MALQTSVFRDGEWVTRTMTVDDMIKSAASKGSKKPRLLKPPRGGILTKTVIESPMTNFILPVRLRTDRHNDVAFINNNSIQVKEFCESHYDGNLQEGEFREGAFREILMKNDFGSRIRNAAVIGCLPDDIIGYNDAIRPPPPSHKDAQLPPQQLVVLLESGEAVFLFARPASDGQYELVATSFPTPLKNVLVNPGFHLAVDPSSRYMALGCAEDLFVVYELETAEVMNQRYMLGQPLQPVRSSQLRSVNGAIHKLDFLHAQKSDSSLIVLLLFMAKDGESRMVTLDWQAGEALDKVLSQEKLGHRLPQSDQLPTLLIPLKMQSAFVMISENHIGVCTEAVHGSPVFISCELESPHATANHHGTQKPLWTAWARPFRYSAQHDCIYLVREDGHIAFLEVDADGEISNSIIMSQKLDCHTAGAVACLLGRSSEILVVGGSYSPGVVYRVPPRKPMVLLGTLPNWATTVDFATTDDFATYNQEHDMHGNPMLSWRNSRPKRPDRIFSTSGRGHKGAVTEFRYGLQARIGVELDYGFVLRQAWVIPHPEGFDLVLSLLNRTAVLRLSDGLNSAAELQDSEEGLQYDLYSRTLAVGEATDDIWLQVTEKWVVLVSPEASRSRRFQLDELLPGLSCINAAVLQETIAVATFESGDYKIHILDLGEGGHYILTPRKTLIATGEITSMHIDLRHGLLAALTINGRPYLARNSVEDKSTTLELIDLETELVSVLGSSPSSSSESALGSVASIASTADLIALGTRNGFVVTLSRHRDQPHLFQRRRFGFTTAIVGPAGRLAGNHEAILVSCDGAAVLLTPPVQRKTYLPNFGTCDQIWLVDTQNLELTVPVDSLTSFPFPIPLDDQSASRLVVLTGSRVLFTEVQQTPGPVNRPLPVHGTPQRIMYSHHLQCLVVAVTRDGRTRLLFLDPDTGEDRGRPSRKAKATSESNERKLEDVEYITGLDKSDDRVYSLIEWEYKKNGNTWRYIVATTHRGQVLVISTAIVENGQIRFWTRQRKRPALDKPVYSVAPYPEGLVYCAGGTVYWDVLDAERGLRAVKQFDLGSAAVSLRPVNDKLMALTHRDSMEVIDPGEKVISHSDPCGRPATDWIEIAGTPPGEPLGSIILVADRDAGLVGLWVPWQVPGKTCEVLFEADLPSSIQTLRRGRTRALWHQDEGRGPRFGRLISTLDDAEILGMGLDGSMTQLTRLDEKAWRLLRYIQNLAMASKEFYPFAHEYTTLDFALEPRMGRDFEMQVDGDMLERLLKKQWLTRLLDQRKGCMKRFQELVKEVAGPGLTATLGSNEDGTFCEEKCLQLAYDIIEYFLAPPL